MYHLGQDKVQSSIVKEPWLFFAEWVVAKANFLLDKDNIPHIVDQPISSLGRLYDLNLLDKNIFKELLEGLAKKVGAVLQSHLVPKGYVATEAVWSYHDSRK